MKLSQTYKLLIPGIAMVLLLSMTIPVEEIDPATLPDTKVELGERLFFDPILSGDKTLSCASCHKPEFAFADNVAFSEGTDGQFPGRNTPTAMYMTGKTSFFWDGRAATLEDQALGPIASPVEMNLPIPEAVSRLQQNPFYEAAFQKIFYMKPSAQLLAKVLAEYQRSLAPYSSPYDRYLQGDFDAMSKSAIRGMELFIYDGNCVQCHLEPHFGGNDFRNIGLFNGQDRADEGRFAITGDSIDLGGFEVSHLRNIAVTGPYMHDGSFETLREVLEYYNDPDKFVHNSVRRDSLMRPLELSNRELNDLEAFLLSLTDEEFQQPK